MISRGRANMTRLRESCGNRYPANIWDRYYKEFAVDLARMVVKDGKQATVNKIINSEPASYGGGSLAWFLFWWPKENSPEWVERLDWCRRVGYDNCPPDELAVNTYNADWECERDLVGDALQGALFDILGIVDADTLYDTFLNMIDEHPFPDGITTRPILDRVAQRLVKQDDTPVRLTYNGHLVCMNLSDLADYLVARCGLTYFTGNTLLTPGEVGRVMFPNDDPDLWISYGWALVWFARNNKILNNYYFKRGAKDDKQ